MVRVGDNAVFAEIHDAAGREFGITAHLRTGESFKFFGVVPEGDSLRFTLAEGERVVARSHLSHVISRQYGSAALKSGAVGSVVGAVSLITLGLVGYVALSPIRDPNQSPNWVEGGLKVEGIGAIFGGVSGLVASAIFGEPKVYWFNEK